MKEAARGPRRTMPSPDGFGRRGQHGETRDMHCASRGRVAPCTILGERTSIVGITILDRYPARCRRRARTQVVGQAPEEMPAVPSDAKQKMPAVACAGRAMNSTNAGPERSFAAVPRTQLQPGAPQAAPRARTVAIVDDKMDAADTLSMALAHLGYDTRIYRSGGDGLAGIASVRPDFALLDITLPDISGYDVARQFAAAPWGKHIKLIAITGWGYADDNADALEAGFHARFVKPVEFQQLASAMDAMCAATGSASS
eukprot:gene38774-47888_t